MFSSADSLHNISPDIITAIVGILGVLIGSVASYFATLRAQRKHMISENLANALSSFFRAYTVYCHTQTKENFSAMLAALDCVRLFCPDRALPLLDDFTQSLVSDDDCIKSTPALYRRLVDLSRAEIHHKQYRQPK